MVKIDLITGFLGSGKTTFIKKYAKYLMDNGENICIAINDYGAVNVDMMLINEIGCDSEMISGGCDYDCHFRRFKTKLIAMALKGYSRVIVEPSGIFDTDEFFDSLYEEPLNKWYEVGNIFTIYDINTFNLSSSAKYVLTTQIATSSKILVSKRIDDSLVDINYLNEILKINKCDRVLTDNDILYLDSINLDDIINSGYYNYSFMKKSLDDFTNFESIYFLNNDYKLEELIAIKNDLFSNKEYGKIIRIKGFIYDNNSWYKINYTENEMDNSIINNGQKVIIVIGESLTKELINNRLNKGESK